MRLLVMGMRQTNVMFLADNVFAGRSRVRSRGFTTGGTLDTFLLLLAASYSTRIFPDALAARLRVFGCSGAALYDINHRRE